MAKVLLSKDALGVKFGEMVELVGNVILEEKYVGNFISNPFLQTMSYEPN